MTKAIIFDIDGVLLDSFEANLKFHQDLMKRFGYKPPTREDYSKCFHLPLDETIKFLTKSEDEEEIKRIWEAGRSREVTYDVTLLTLAEKAEEIISEFSKKFLLGIVTSRVKNGVYESPEMAKLEKHFRVVVSFEDTKNHKPDPEPLLLAAKRLGVKPTECIYIGDTETDMIAANAAGMNIITYAKEPTIKSDVHAYNFSEIPELVSRLETK